MIEDIVQNMISQLGQSQDERIPGELGVHFADVDERTPKDLLLFTKRFARFINYYSGHIKTPAGTWEPFFTFDADGAQELAEKDDGDTTPHLALLIAFLRLYQEPRQIINGLTRRHLDFFYRRVLQFAKKPAVPDKAHVLIGLKKNSAPITIGPANVFSAGKDDKGVELIYAPTRETVINNAKVESLRSIYVDKSGHGTVRFAPIPKSADGAGAPLPADDPKWHAFGHENLPAAKIGFAIASPLLRMNEGTRKVIVSLTLGNVNPSTMTGAALAGIFDVFLTSTKNWLGPYRVSPQVTSGNVLTFEFNVPASDPAVTDYDAAVHGLSFRVVTPVMQVFFNSGISTLGYNELKDLTLQKVTLSADVRDVTSLVLESDAGGLDPKKAFLPFGPQPDAGSRFVIGCEEALSKNLSELTITVQWKGAPASFSTHYANYGFGANDLDFTASVSFADAGTWVETKTGMKLFNPEASDSPVTFTFSPSDSSKSTAVSQGAKVFALSKAGTGWALNAALKEIRLNPFLASFMKAPPQPRSGFITFVLEKDFLHDKYRLKYVQNIVTFSKAPSGTLVILNEPYTPAIQAISLSYKAHTSDVNIESATLENFANPDAQFFHIGCFGQMLEHGYQREQFEFLPNKSVSLLPQYQDEGEFLIGLSNLKAGDSVSILFQAAEGSADPGLDQEEIQWFALCDNYWKRLGTSEVVLDTTNQLLTSGLIGFVIPAEATTQNTVLPPGYVWLKAAVAQNVRSVSQFIDVAGNAVEVEFKDNDNDPNHLNAALEAKHIAKLKSGLTAVKTVTQPYASFGGRPLESDEALNTRASERLRHKNRCITAWDYERAILEAFPAVHKVKCIPHAKDGLWLAPGHVLLVVVPDLRNKNAIDPLQPRVDTNTLSEIRSFLQTKTGMQVSVDVKNPRYQKIQLDFKVKFHKGYEFNFYSGELKQALIQLLSPWAYQSDRPIVFGGHVYKSVLLDFVEDLDYVDYLTDFKMYSYSGDVNDHADINEVRPETPDAILVSDHTHLVLEAD